MTQMEQTIENIRTMLESYNQVAEAAEAYNVGKVLLAQAITNKGVETSPTESYPEMAQKVNAIVQTQQVIDGGEMYGKQLFGSLTAPDYWNLYDILTQLLSDGRLTNYGGILLAEYYRGYNSLALSGAGSGGAYVVSDKDGNGNFIMYTEDTTHTWATEWDGKGNRWVAYCFASAGHNFEITDTGTSPRSIFIGRNVGTLSLLTNSRHSQIVIPDGSKLNKFIPNEHTVQYGKSIVLRNIGDLGSKAVLTNGTIAEEIYIKADSMKNAVNNTACVFVAQDTAKCVIIETDLIDNCVFKPTNDSDTTSRTLIIKAKEITKTISSSDSAIVKNFMKGSIVFLGLESLNVNFVFYGSNPDYMYFGYDTNDRTKFISLTVTSTSLSNLVDIELQDGWCKPLAISSATSLTEENIVNHILNRLGDNSGQSPLTITLGATNLAKLTAEEIAIATNKGFTLA